MAGAVTKAIAPPIVDNQHAPEIFADGYHGVTINSGVIRLNLFSIRMNPETGELSRTIAARLTMPFPSFVSTYNALTEVLQDLQKEGVVQIEHGARKNE
jgi:hypothetical protein